MTPKQMNIGSEGTSVTAQCSNGAGGREVASGSGDLRLLWAGEVVGRGMAVVGQCSNGAGGREVASGSGNLRLLWAGEVVGRGDGRRLGTAVVVGCGAAAEREMGRKSFNKGKRKWAAFGSCGQGRSSGAAAIVDQAKRWSSSAVVRCGDGRRARRDGRRAMQQRSGRRRSGFGNLRLLWAREVVGRGSSRRSGATVVVRRGAAAEREMGRESFKKRREKMGRQKRENCQRGREKIEEKRRKGGEEREKGERREKRERAGIEIFLKP
ncbi:hypothetical protein BT93_A0757 [Corymbia citriodora subsp. variegata]|nr:hypothetical protein BT93_A0757 [Corymbia citriodora subsp. variegata]